MLWKNINERLTVTQQHKAGCRYSLHPTYARQFTAMFNGRHCALQDGLFEKLPGDICKTYFCCFACSLIIAMQCKPTGNKSNILGLYESVCLLVAADKPTVVTQLLQLRQLQMPYSIHSLSFKRQISSYAQGQRMRYNINLDFQSCLRSN